MIPFIVSKDTPKRRGKKIFILIILVTCVLLIRLARTGNEGVFDVEVFDYVGS